jgi:hypothetical protein
MRVYKKYGVYEGDDEFVDIRSADELHLEE